MVDGYLARKSKSVSHFGAILDPVMDKFFVYFAIGALFTENKITFWGAAAMLSRDFFLCLYGLVILAKGRWSVIVFRAIRWGKATTALQFLVLIGLVVGFNFPSLLFTLFVGMGFLAFMELIQVQEQPSN